jgi:SAM-dependent methyltransferase
MQVDGIDLSEAQIELARRRAQRMGVVDATFRCASTDALTGETSYDGAVIHATLHHLDKRQRENLLDQLDALLKPGGRVYMYEPVAPIWPRPLSARALDRGIGVVVRSLRGLARALRLTDEEIRLALEDGWTMRSPKEAPIVLSDLASELPKGLRLSRVRYWHVFCISYANFCMELKPPWQAAFSPGTIPFYLLDRLILGLGIGKHLLSWPMAAIQLEKPQDGTVQRGDDPGWRFNPKGLLPSEQ